MLQTEPTSSVLSYLWWYQPH